MKIAFNFFLLVVLFLTSSLGSVTTIRAQNLIKWTKDSKLKWSDFKAKPDTSVFAYALTSYRVEIEPKDVLIDQNNNIIDYSILSASIYFDSDLSWVYKKDDYLLKHEQLHFDIAALYGKKINEEFEKLKTAKIGNYDAYIQVYQRLWAECRTFQKQYDKETGHGILKDVNDKWIAEVSAQLEKGI